MYKKTVLNNGLRVLTCKMADRQSIGLGIWVCAGGRYEDKRNKGVAHFLEHLLFKGTKKYSNRAIKESIEGIGGTLNAFTSEEHTCYFVKIPKKYVKLSLNILADMVINPLLKTTDIERERTVILEEIKMYRDMPQHYVNDLLENLLWPGHPLGIGIAGSEKSIGSLNRKDIAGFKDVFYQPANLLVVACGDIKHRDIVSMSDKLFKKQHARAKTEFLKAGNVQNKASFKLAHKDVEQTHIALGLHSYKREHPSNYALGILNTILGGNMSSRLFHELREKRGLAYAVGSSARVLQDTGAFFVRAGVDNRKVVDSIKVILKELKKISKFNVSKKELDRAKEYYSGQLMLALEDTLDHMIFAGEKIATINRVKTPAEISRKIKKVSVADVRQVAGELFKKHSMNIALVGPVTQKDKKAIKKLIGIG